MVEWNEFFEWTQKYLIQEACLEELNRRSWKNGFICVKSDYYKSCQLKHCTRVHQVRPARYLKFLAGKSVVRFNHRFWEHQLPNRLLQAAVEHVPIRGSLNVV